MTAEEARAAILAGRTIRSQHEPSGPEDPVCLHYLNDGVIYSESVAGWSAGVVEPICSADSPFYVREYADRVLELVPLPEPSEECRA